MAALPINATPEQIEDEIVFVGVQIKTLDPDADDYEHSLTTLETQQQRLQSLLDAAQQLGRRGPTTNAPSKSPMRRDAWWQSATGNTWEGPNVFNGDDGSSTSLSGQEDPLPNRSKRPRSQSNLHGASPVSKRPLATLGLSGPSSSISSGNDLMERTKRRHEVAEAQLRRQQELKRSDAEIARQMSQGFALPGQSSSAPTSSQPHTQATLDFDGGFHRLPSIKSNPVSELGTQQISPFTQQANSAPRRMIDSSPALLGPPKRPVGASVVQGSPWQQPSPQPHQQTHNVQQAYQGRNLPWNLTQPLPHVKGEPSPSRYQQLFSTPRQSTPVVDLTASDSDDDVKEVYQRKVQAARNAPGPSHSSLPRAPSTHVSALHIPGAYPGTPPVYSTAHQSPSTSQYWNSQVREQMLNSGNAYRSMGPGPSMPTQDLSYLIHGRGPGAMLGMDDDGYYDEDDDDDGFYSTGSRQLPYGSYAGNEDLYRSRYSALAAYDATKSDEEIQKLLQNIRPDEEMPEHLRVKTPESMTISLHKYQEAGLTWLQECEKGSNQGGILADDMGLGKTIQMLSLLVTNKSQDACKTTLIVAPVALMRQWQQEIQQKIKPGRHALTVYLHHGSAKKKHFRDLQHYDVVLTTFGSLAVEAKKMELLRLRRLQEPTAQPGPKEQCALLGNDARWYRVILDEAQCIKNKSTKTAKGACMVNAKFRWCMTGTPMMNNVEELYSLISFLRIKPYSQWEKFRMDLKIPLKSGDPTVRDTAMRRLQTLCKAIMLRRTKKSEYMNRPILILPERTTEIDNPEFSEDETSFYQALETKSQLQFNKYLRRGVIKSSYSAILVLLLRLRQACCHPHLIKDFGVSVAADVTEDQMLEMAQLLSEPVVARIKEMNGTFECPVCYDVTPNPAIFIPCGHDTCSECFAKLTDPAQAIQNGDEGAARFKCPNCRGPIDPKRLTDFTSFKKVHAPEMLTEQEAAQLGADEAEEDSDAESDDSSTESEGDDSDGDSDDSKGSLKDFIVDEDEEEDQDVKGGKQKRATTKCDEVKEEDEDEDEEDSDDLDNGVKAEKAAGSSVKQEHNEDGEAGPSDATLMANSKSSEKTRKSKKKRKGKGKDNGKGKGKEKEKKKKVKAAITLAELKKRANRNLASRKEYLRRVRKDWVSSAKIDKTMEILREVMESEEGEKVLIFSQWTSLLDLLEVPIDECGYGYRRYDGSMNAGMRGDAVDDFRDERKNVRIMLVSLKAGNAGLNLNMASQVIILDPFWNPYIEEQAIDRAHRIGQQRPVKIHRVLIQNTVEDRIIELQEKKRALISEALDEKAGQSISRLGVQELAYLFGVTSNLSEQVNYVDRDRRG